MGWARLTTAVDEPDPMRQHRIETLASAIQTVLDGRGELDKILIRRRHGQRGWQSTGLGLGPEPDDDDLDPQAAALELLAMLDAHAEAEGAGQYQILALGTNKSGNPSDLFKIAIKAGDVDDVPDDKDTEVADLLRGSRQVVDSMSGLVSALTTNMGRLSGEVVGMLEIAQKQGAALAEVRKAELEFESHRIDREFEARDADREMDLSKHRMDKGMNVIGLVADGYMAKMNADAHKAAAEAGTKMKDVKRGDAQKKGLKQIFDSLTSEEKDAAREAVGGDVWDLFVAAVQKDDADERNAILKQIKAIFNEWGADEQKRRTDALKAAIDEKRTVGLMMMVGSAT